MKEEPLQTQSMATTVTMTDLFERAEREGLWFYSSYQQIWFTPPELRELRQRGRFQWGPVSWQLRDPREALADAEQELTQAQERCDALKQRIAAATPKEVLDVKD